MTQVIRVAPHNLIPGMVTPIYQDVPYEKALAEVTHFGELGSDILYQPTLSRFHTPTAIAQTWRGHLDVASYSLGQISFPYYSIMAKNQSDPGEEAKFGKLVTGIGLQDFLDDLCKQGIAQRQHYATWFGFDADATQGILLNAGTVTTIPNDSESHSTIVSYLPAELFQLLTGYARQIMNATYNTAKPVVVVSTTEIINYLQTIIIPIASYQMPGAGVDSVGGAFQRVVGTWLGVGKVEFIADNALAGKGANGTDLLSLIAPGLSDQEVKSDQTLVQRKMPQNMRNTFVDEVSGIRTYNNPVIDGVKSKLFSLQTTPGCLIRPEAVVTLEVTYSA